MSRNMLVLTSSKPNHFEWRIDGPTRAGNGSRRVTQRPSELWPMINCLWPMTHISYYCIEALESSHTYVLWYARVYSTVISKWKWQLDNCYEIVCIDRATFFALGTRQNCSAPSENPSLTYHIKFPLSTYVGVYRDKYNNSPASNC